MADTSSEQSDTKAAPSKDSVASEKDVTKSSKRVRIDDENLRRSSTATSEHRPSFPNSPRASSINILALTKSSQTVTASEDKPSHILNLDIPGLARINLSTLTQKIIGCIIGENVTTEYPWIYVKKEIIEDNLDLHDESSDFLPIKSEIQAFPEKEILIGYAPTTIEGGRFYVCLTEDCTNAVLRHIENLRLEQGNRVRKSVYKTPGKWEDLGSAWEVDGTIVKNNRPLIEIEIQSTSASKNRAVVLKDRAVEDVRDGYISLVPSNLESFENVYKLRIDTGINASSPVKDRGSQTNRTLEVNSWSQYAYECPSMKRFLKRADNLERLNSFFRKHADEMCKQLKINGTWDIYKDDLIGLVKDIRDTLPPAQIGYLENQSYYEGTLCKNKVINSLAWHPLWTGLAAVAYTDISNCDNFIGPKPYNEVLRACQGMNYILVWSFDDCLSPKLILESPREVTAVTICPYDGNVIIGGCANGQIGIWDVPGAIKKIEKVMIHTSAEVKYKIAMKSLMTWMRESGGDKYFRPAAMSSLTHSQKGSITKIVWVPPYNKVDKNGRIHSLPEDTNVEDLVWQFITSSDDGTVAFWDLKWRPAETVNPSEPQQEKKEKHKPKSLAELVSVYKVLDGVFSPHYLLIVQDENFIRSSVISFSMHRSRFHKEAADEISTDDDIYVRKHYTLHIEKADFEMKPTIFVGTLKGECGMVTWDGYEFSTGVAVNKEQVRWAWKNNLHDGPVCVAARSIFLRDIIATIGGRIYAIWSENYENPVFWRESNYRYTACCWSMIRPTVLLLARNDGTVEIWDFLIRSDKPHIIQSVSGRIITGIYVHELPLQPPCLCFSDFNGTLRLFTVPKELFSKEIDDTDWMRQFIDLQVNANKRFREWKVQWNEANMKYIAKKTKYAQIAAKRKIADIEKSKKSTKSEIASAVSRIDQETTAASKQSKAVKDISWTEIELRRMQRDLLETKGLREDELERKRAPALKLRQEALTKKRKFRELLKQQDQILEENVAHLFPEQRLDNEPIMVSSQSLTVPIPSDEGKDVSTKGKGVSHGDFASPDDEIMNNFREIQSDAFTFMTNEPFKRAFDWRKIITEGKARRQSMDILLKQCNKPKSRTSKKIEIKESVDFLLRPSPLKDYESTIRIADEWAM